MDESAAPPQIIDTDVHVHAPSVEELGPYLDPYWHDELKSVAFHVPPGVSYTYPAWSAMFGTPPVTLAQLRSQALADRSFAVLQCCYGLESLSHPYLAAALARAVNGWIQEEWLSRDGRLRGSIIVAPQHAEEAVAEIHRMAADPRFVQVLVAAHAIEPYGARRFWPIWEAATDHGLPIALMAGGLSGTPPTPVNWPSTFFELYGSGGLAFASQVNSLGFSGVFAEYPELRFVLCESGWSWLPALMWRMDWEWRAGFREVPWVLEEPSAYIRRHFRLTTQPSDIADVSSVQELVDQFGGDRMLMFSSDFPHRYTADPEALLEHLDAGSGERIGWQNAAELYNLV